MRLDTSAAVAAVVAVAVGCGSVKVVPLGSGLEITPRPPDCAIEFLEKAPDREYESLASLEAHVTSPGPLGPLEVLRKPACQVGADAVIVARSFVTNHLGHVLVAGTAIRYREASPPPEQPEPPRAPSGPVWL